MDPLRILTWEGYVTAEDTAKVNTLLHQQGYDIKVEVIEPHAEGAEQMYKLMREGKVDVPFLTLFFIKLHGDMSSNLIQPIDTNSPRLTNYRHLLPELTRLSMGMKDSKPLYIPFSGGAYGFYINSKTVSPTDVPKSWADLLSPRWKGRYSLNEAQIWYNVAVAAMALGKKPFYVNDLAIDGQRDAVIRETSEDSPLALKLTALYGGAGDFWDAIPFYSGKLDIVSSWGLEVAKVNREGGDWRLLDFKEGNLVWIDTINFSSNLKGSRLEAAEIAANYFIGKEVQNRVVSQLSLVAVSSLASSNPVLKKHPKFFASGGFMPPYNTLADNRVKAMSDKAIAKAKSGQSMPLSVANGQR